MRSAMSYVVVAVVGLMVCGKTPVALAAEEEAEHQATRHEEVMTAPSHHPEMMEQRGPVRVLWPGNRAKAEVWCAVGLLKGALLVWLVCNVLLAAWVFTDIRKLGQGHGIFVALALLAGFPAAILYALVRLGDKKS